MANVDVGGHRWRNMRLKIEGEQIIRPGYVSIVIRRIVASQVRAGPFQV
jgi:hypothetical protein